MRALLRPLFILSLLLLLVPCLNAVAERRPPVSNGAARQSVVVEYKRAYARPSQSLLGKLFGKRKASHSRHHRSH